MEKKAKIIATLGPAIYSENKLKKLIELGVDAFRINFSHNTSGIGRIISKIRRIEKKNGKKLSVIEMKENYNAIKNYNINKINNGHLCSTCDYFLLLISEIFEVNINHNYIKYKILIF